MPSKYPTVPEDANAHAVGSMSLAKVKAKEKIPEEKIPRNIASAFIAARMRHEGKLKAMGLRKKKGAIRAPIKSRVADVTGTGIQTLHFKAPSATAQKIAKYIERKFKVKVTLKLSQESVDTIATLTQYDSTGRAYLSTCSHNQVASIKRAYAKEQSAMKGKIMPFTAWVGATIVPEAHMQMR